MRRITAAIALAFALSACTPAQMAWYSAFHDAGGDAAAAIDATVAQYAAERDAATAGRLCVDWYDYAIEVGFTPEQWAEPISRIMWRESRCNPGAVGPTDDWGIMQIHGPWVGALCSAGIACSRAELLDPSVNLRAAFYVYGVQGWRAWMAY